MSSKARRSAAGTGWYVFYEAPTATEERVRRFDSMGDAVKFAYRLAERQTEGIQIYDVTDDGCFDGSYNRPSEQGYDDITWYMRQVGVGPTRRIQVMLDGPAGKEVRYVYPSTPEDVGRRIALMSE